MTSDRPNLRVVAPDEPVKRKRKPKPPPSYRDCLKSKPVRFEPTVKRPGEYVLVRGALVPCGGEMVNGETI